MGKKFIKRLLVLVMAMCMMLTMSVTVLAAGEEGTDPIEEDQVQATTDDPTDGILQVYLAYVDDNGTRTLLYGGTCFLINEEYVLSNYHIFNLDEVDNSGVTKREAIMNMLNLDELPNNDPHLKVFVYANRDMSVEATIHESVQSSAMDFVALKLSDKIYDRQPLVLGDSSIMKQQDVVYALGFPSDSIENKEFNTKADVSVVDGTISKVTVREKADVFEHTAPLNSGNSGGPLLNALNEVIGINTFIYGNNVGTKSYTVQINALKSALDTFGIAYTDGVHDRAALDGGAVASSAGTVNQSGSDDTADTDTEEQNQALLTELNNEISRAKAMDTEGYTEESVQVLNDTIESAEDVAASTDATEAQIQTAIDDVRAAVDGLEEQSGLNIILIAGIGAAVLIIVIIIIVVIVLATSGKKKKANAAGGGNVPPVPPVQPVQNPQPMHQPQMYAPGNGTVPQAEGAGETTLLDSGAGETTLLSGAGGGAYLIRKKNGEKIMITSQNFAIGKERRRVNYCISDNTSVSRFHAVITKKGSDYYIADQKSSNFTFVNGVQLSPYKDTLLTDRSTIKLSDEEFEFHLS
ncbi:MAG TPA: trypsin-like peptidase domain-containing protein [Candidatus Mediterraneibacter stercoravium]|uniref:Trypsin-like peptidase domain-containing protein n=1 Tax=Candidatus Mediterraneibacter stercoravium TaxID=2838685 RepID=A0A9D2K1J3_9FIRM|nr:trypsin-like peptidase domain-containing protein [Candidatus Mediterraneibacter stercoravium]